MKITVLTFPTRTQMKRENQLKCLISQKLGEMKPVHENSQPAFPCSKLTRETREQGVKYVQS